MDVKTLLVSAFLFGSLFLAARAAAAVDGGYSSSSSYDNIEQALEEYFDFDHEGYPFPEMVRARRVHVNVDDFGAVGDGVSDDTLAFTSAWNKSCSTARSVLMVPSGRKYLVNATRFKGPCAKRFIVQIDGTIVAPGDPKMWDPKLPRTWLEFSNLSGVVFQGSGVIDGSGSNWWAASCKKNKTNPCKGAPTAFRIDSSTAIKMKGLTLRNSQQMHFVVSRCNSVRLYDIEVSSPGDSPNTDGIHITASTNVMMQNFTLFVGDDCVSIVNGSSNIKMKSMYCGPFLFAALEALERITRQE